LDAIPHVTERPATRKDTSCKASTSTSTSSRA
jgi:hypothetical protein